MTFLRRLALFVLLAVAVVAAGSFGLRRWARQPLVVGNGDAIEVTIAPGSSLRAIGAQIAAAGLPLNTTLFTALARVERRGNRLQAGTYAIAPTATPERILDKLESGDVIRIALVVPEGWTFAQMRTLIAQQPDIRQTAAKLTDDEVMTAIGAPGRPPEGLFFPDTYVYTRGTTDVDLFRRAYRAMQRRLDDAWASRAPDLPFATPYEALTLASVVEKETGRPEDRPLVAAVFVNRLRRGMLLQTDPTVIYGLGARFDGNLRRADLVADSPYNTYLRPGLPPTPIALAGAAALAAVVNPPHSDALYFVARGDGTSEFSERLNDHNRAVDRYQRGPRAPGTARP